MSWMGDKFRDWLDGGTDSGSNQADNAKPEDAKNPPEKEGS